MPLATRLSDGFRNVVHVMFSPRIAIRKNFIRYEDVNGCYIIKKSGDVYKLEKSKRPRQIHSRKQINIVREKLASHIDPRHMSEYSFLESDLKFAKRRRLRAA